MDIIGGELLGYKSDGKGNLIIELQNVYPSKHQVKKYKVCGDVVSIWKDEIKVNKILEFMPNNYGYFTYFRNNGTIVDVKGQIEEVIPKKR